MFELLLIASLLCTPFVVPFCTNAGRPRRTSTPQPVAAGKHRRMSPRQATAVEAAVARVVTAGPLHAGHTLQLPCRGCGTRAIPPVEHVDSPPIPFERAALVPLGHVGFVITAMCTACDSPLISRVLDEEHADHARQLGAIDGELLEAELARTLATL